MAFLENDLIRIFNDLLNRSMASVISTFIRHKLTRVWQLFEQTETNSSLQMKKISEQFSLPSCSDRGAELHMPGFAVTSISACLLLLRQTTHRLNWQPCSSFHSPTRFYPTSHQPLFFLSIFLTLLHTLWKIGYIINTHARSHKTVRTSLFIKSVAV